MATPINVSVEGLLGGILNELSKQQRDRPQFTIRPATADELAFLLAGAAYQPAVGDVVRLRDGAADHGANLAHPKPGEDVVVTQVFPPTRDTRRLETPVAGDMVNFAVAMMAEHECDKPECEEPQLVELVFDSRYFEKVGSVERSSQ